MHRKTGFTLLLSLLILAGCRTNTAPNITNFSASPSSGDAPLKVTFSISANDADSDPLTCIINFGDSSSPASLPCGTPLSTIHNYESAGSYTATLVVDDGRGGSDSASVQIIVTEPPAPAGACPASGSLSLRTQALETKKALKGMGRFEGAAYVPGELLVLRPEGVSLQSTEIVRIEEQLGLERLAAPKLDGWVRYQVAPGDEAKLAERILESGLGAYVQPNYRYMPLYTPNDTHYITDQKIQYDLIHITQAWDDLSPDACRPIVGVIDSGTADDHPDLDLHVIAGYDLSDGDADPYPAAGNDHGTMVSSIIAAETNNGQGMAGSTNNLAYIMPLKVFPNGTSGTIASAIKWARQHGVHVLNMSICIFNDDKTACADLTSNPDVVIEAELQTAYDQGIVTLAASGNFNDSFVGYPASSQYTIAVGAINNNNPPQRADGGDWCPNTDPNCGRGSNYGPNLDIVAPGTSVIGAAIPSRNDPEPYFVGSGTSFAAPYAAGVAALYISQYYAKNAGLPTPSQVTTCLRSAAQDLDPAGVDVETGAGLVRADRVMDTVTNAYGCY